MTRRLGCGRRRRPVEDHRCQHGDGRLGLAGIGLEFLPVSHRIGVEIEDARVEVAFEGIDRQIVAAHRLDQRGGHGRALPRRLGLGFLGGQPIAPPLQPDLARHRLADVVADPRGLDRERIQRPRPSRRSSGAKPTETARSASPSCTIRAHSA